MKLIYFLTMLFVTGLLMTGCKPDDYKLPGTANDNLTAISGNWNLVKVTQTDAESKRKGFPYAEEDITALYNYSAVKLALNLSSGAPAAFAITNGDAPPIATLTAGTWTVDDAAAPKVVTLKSGTATEALTLGGYPNSVNSNLKVTLTRSDAATGKALIVYTYEFSR